MKRRLHCVHEGPWWKRLRMKLFGLTAREAAENFAIHAEMQREIMEEIRKRDAADEAFVEKMMREGHWWDHG